MIAKGQGVEARARDFIRILEIRANDREKLPLHPSHGIIIEARIVQGFPKKRDAFIAVFGQHFRRDRH